ncbi:hypothetical protein SAMN02745673_01669 [Marinactinospora thermotolerans DSM 45154]|uniref:Uncharacterized protein n=1 Tax=Marinactinospora thermotolerans DSM 45154 TaxID=1122192 RepID=A0A1T4P7N8_9ACTN|nr:hypothetical protein SAMN02745673_01669 [Marinactinospora thermotolerans DSM 45154]
MLVVEDGVDEAAECFGGGVADGGGADDEVGEAFESEEGAVGVAGFGDAVGVEQDAVAGLEPESLDAAFEGCVEEAGQAEGGFGGSFEGVVDDALVADEQGWGWPQLVQSRVPVVRWSWRKMPVQNWSGSQVERAWSMRAVSLSRPFPVRRALRQAAMATEVARPEARSWPMESRMAACRVSEVRAWSKASPPRL